ncbi:MAG: carboxypeptidase-like regulatory domain-containing protein, partial [Acidobacteriota bacterium]|nr:carboxypeptidase-like regulatory domain-containing protein [Acidobacteriota bacterium]
MKSFARMFLLIGLIAGMAATAEARDNKGRITGNVSDFFGSPVKDALIRVIQIIDGAEKFISVRSDEYGFFKTPALSAGIYSLNISHNDYSAVATTQFVVDNSRSVSLEIALRNFADSLTRDEDPRNQDFRQVLRGVSDRRLIFRAASIPGVAENTPDPFTHGGVMSIAAGTSPSESYFLRPQANQSGISSNFAFTEPLNSTSRIILSGQVDSGEGSFWRLRNTYSYRTDRNHDYSISVGYGRMTGNYLVPDTISSSTNFRPMTDGLETFAFGTEGETRLFNVLSIRYGVDYTRLYYDSDKRFFSPSLRILLTPVEGWSLEAFITSKPQNDNNSVVLPSGETLNLAEPTFITIAGDKVSMSQVRHSEAVVRKNFAPGTSVELAFYQDYISGPGIPMLVTTVTPSDRRSCIIEANGEDSSQKGLRFLVKHRIFEHLTGSVAYIYGESKEIAPDAQMETIASLKENPGVFMQRGYRHSIAGHVGTFIPRTRTNIIAMLRWNS